MLNELNFGDIIKSYEVQRLTDFKIDEDNLKNRVQKITTIMM